MLRDSALKSLLKKANKLFELLVLHCEEEREKLQEDLRAEAFTLKKQYQNVCLDLQDGAFFFSSIAPQIEIAGKQFDKAQQIQALSAIFECPVNLDMTRIVRSFFSVGADWKMAGRLAESASVAVCHPAWIIYCIDNQESKERPLEFEKLYDFLLPFIFLNTETVKKFQEALRPYLKEGESSVEWLKRRMTVQKKSGEISPLFELALAFYEANLSGVCHPFRQSECCFDSRVLNQINQLIFLRAHSGLYDSSLIKGFLDKLSVILWSRVQNEGVIASITGLHFPLLAKGLISCFLSLGLRSLESRSLKEIFFSFLKSSLTQVAHLSFQPGIVSQQAVVITYIIESILHEKEKLGQSFDLVVPDLVEFIKAQRMEPSVVYGMLLLTIESFQKIFPALDQKDIKQRFLSAMEYQNSDLLSLPVISQYLELLQRAAIVKRDISGVALPSVIGLKMMNFPILHKIIMFYIALNDYHAACKIMEWYFENLNQELSASNVFLNLQSVYLEILERLFALDQEQVNQAFSDRREDSFFLLGLDRTPSKTEEKLKEYYKLRDHFDALDQPDASGSPRSQKLLALQNAVQQRLERLEKFMKEYPLAPYTQWQHSEENLLKARTSFAVLELLENKDAGHRRLFFHEDYAHEKTS